MPILRVPRAELDKAVRALEAAGDRIVSLTVDGPDVLVLTEPGRAER